MREVLVLEDLMTLSMMISLKGFLEKGKDSIQEKGKLGQVDQVLLSLKMVTY